MMKNLPPVADNIQSLTPYQQGKPIAELQRELNLTGIIKLASNECPLGPSPLALAAVAEALPGMFRYPDGGGFELRQALARHHQLSPDNICLANGSNEVIEMLCRTFIRPGARALSVAPSFLMYEKMVQVAGGIFRQIPLDRNYRADLKALGQALEPETRLIFINNPNNPAGTIVRRSELEEFLAHLPPGIIVVLDEAYIDFNDDPACARGEDFLDHQAPVVVMRTFSKIAGLAGLRIGYALAAGEIIDYFNRVRQPFNTSLLAQAAALAALRDDEFQQRHQRLVRGERERYYKTLTSLGLFHLPSQANFILLRIGPLAQAVFEDMLKLGVILRWMGAYDLPEFIRISIGKPEENIRCLESLARVLERRGII
jgi:histidinol-phosphate aminotransferase